MTTAHVRPIDHQRAGRLLLGWLRNDRLAIDTAVNDAADDPIGTPGVVFAMTNLAAELATQIATDDADQQIEQALLRLAHEYPDEDPS